MGQGCDLGPPGSDGCRGRERGRSGRARGRARLVRAARRSCGSHSIRPSPDQLRRSTKLMGCWWQPTALNWSRSRNCTATCPTTARTRSRPPPPRSPEGPRWTGCGPCSGRSAACPTACELVARIGGVAFYDDSKATAPARHDRGRPRVPVRRADRRRTQQGTRSVRSLRGHRPGPRRWSASATSASEVLAAFGDRPGRVATSMGEAVRAAHAMARPGDVVLLSPGCASFDWYGSYGERGDHFRSEVEALVLEDPT